MGSNLLTVFGDLLSQPSRAVYILCRSSNIPHKFKCVKIQGLIHKTPAYAKISPFKTLPSIRDGDLILRDSGAILTYLATSRPDHVKDHWYPKDLEQRARVDEYLSWHHLNTRAACFGFYFTKWIAPMFTGKTPKPESVSRKLKQMEKTLDQIEKVWLSEGRVKFINDADEITLADLQLACELEQLILTGYDVRKMRPVLGNHMDTVRLGLNPYYDEAHEAVYEIVRTHPNGQVPGRLYTSKEMLKARLKHFFAPPL